MRRGRDRGTAVPLQAPRSCAFRLPPYAHALALRTEHGPQPLRPPLPRYTYTPSCMSEKTLDKTPYHVSEPGTSFMWRGVIAMFAF